MRKLDHEITLTISRQNYSAGESHRFHRARRPTDAPGPPSSRTCARAPVLPHLRPGPRPCTPVPRAPCPETRDPRPEPRPPGSLAQVPLLLPPLSHPVSVLLPPGLEALWAGYPCSYPRSHTRSLSSFLCASRLFGRSPSALTPALTTRSLSSFLRASRLFVQYLRALTLAPTTGSSSSGARVSELLRPGLQRRSSALNSRSNQVRIFIMRINQLTRIFNCLDQLFAWITSDHQIQSRLNWYQTASLIPIAGNLILDNQSSAFQRQEPSRKSTLKSAPTLTSPPAEPFDLLWRIKMDASIQSNPIRVNFNSESVWRGGGGGGGER